MIDAGYMAVLVADWARADPPPISIVVGEAGPGDGDAVGEGMIVLRLMPGEAYEIEMLAAAIDPLYPDRAWSAVNVGSGVAGDADGDGVLNVSDIVRWAALLGAGGVAGVAVARRRPAVKGAES